MNPLDKVRYAFDQMIQRDHVTTAEVAAVVGDPLHVVAKALCDYLADGVVCADLSSGKLEWRRL